MTVEMIETSATGALAGRLFGAGVGALELCGVYVGIRLDLYRTLADGPLSAAELAARTGCAERYLREWLQHQAVAGLLTADGADPTTARFALADGVTDVLVDETGPADLGDATADWTPRYDVVFFFECVHDLPRPVEALRHARSALTAGGTVIVMDERAADTFTAPGDDVERFLAAASALWCLPQGLVGTDPQPVGALLRPSTMDALAARAGYRATEILPIEHPVWRFYRLLP